MLKAKTKYNLNPEGIMGPQERKALHRRPFSVITHHNKYAAAKRIRGVKEGIMLVAEPGWRSRDGIIRDATILLYNTPVFVPSENRLRQDREQEKSCGGSVDVRPGLDCQYHLRRTKDELGTFYKVSSRFEVSDEFCLEVAPQRLKGVKIFERGTTVIFAPKKHHRKQALASALHFMVPKLNETLLGEGLDEKRLGTPNIHAIVEFMMEGLHDDGLLALQSRPQLPLAHQTVQ